MINGVEDFKEAIHGFYGVQPSRVVPYVKTWKDSNFGVGDREKHYEFGNDGTYVFLGDLLLQVRIDSDHFDNYDNYSRHENVYAHATVDDGVSGGFEGVNYAQNLEFYRVRKYANQYLETIQPSVIYNKLYVKSDTDVYGNNSDISEVKLMFKGYLAYLDKELGRVAGAEILSV